MTFDMYVRVPRYNARLLLWILYSSRDSEPDQASSQITPSYGRHRTTESHHFKLSVKFRAHHFLGHNLALYDLPLVSFRLIQN